MEISEELLRRIVRETIQELGAQADAELIRKVVLAVIRRLQQEQPSPPSYQP